MDPQRSQIKAAISASVFKGSYIGGFRNPESIKKSQLLVDSLRGGQDQQIDDKTFRIMQNFVKPTENISIYRQTGKCFIETDSFFSCFSGRRPYDFELNNSKFYIRSADKIVRFVDFNVVWAELEQKSDALVLTFNGSDAKLYIEVTGNNKAEQLTKLIGNFRNLIQMTDGKKNKMNYLATKNPLNFFKTEHVLYSQFQKCANSGDILLFKSQHSAATVQRIFTDSEYDHVGVILRNRKNQIFIYESTSDSGVGFTKWNQFIRYQWYTLIDKITWRPLTINLTASDIQTIQKFVVKTLGKQFQLNIDKLFTFKSTLDRTKQQEEKKTYFCSQLVARLYKELGILNEEKSSTSYYPVDFSDRGSLKIVREGVKLGNERLISFDKI